MSPTPDHPRRSSQRAFTLIEAVMAMAITAILLVGMSAALVASARAADLGTDANAHAASTAMALDQIRAELSVATKFSARTPTRVAFSVPDRDADGSAETIEYSWAGRAGEPLYRDFNASGPLVLIPSCNAVNFSFLVRPAPVIVSEPRQTFLSYIADLSAGSRCVTLSSRNVAAQLWTPSGVASGKFITISTVRVALTKGGGQASTIRMRIFAADAGSPTGGTLLGTSTILSTDITAGSSYFMTPFQFSSQAIVPSGAGVWFVIDAPAASGNAAWIAYDVSSPTLPALGNLMSSSDSGGSWTDQASSDLSIEITGALSTVTYPPEELQ